MFAQLGHLLVNKIFMLENEVLCDLMCEGLVCLQKKDGYKITTDSVLLANFVKCNKDEIGLEVCSGSGVISILVNAKQHPKSIKLVEIQPELAIMCGRTLRINGIKNLSVMCCDLRDYALIEDEHKFDFVIANPPYFKAGKGRLPKSEEKIHAKFETKLNLDSCVSSIAKLIKAGGRLYMVYTSSRLDELKEVLKLHEFCVSKMAMVKVSKNKPHHIVLIEAFYKENCQTKLLEDVIISDENGKFTKQYADIYNGQYLWR